MRYECTMANGRAVSETTRRILVPVDFSDASLAALEYAVELAERRHASVEAVHVWDLPVLPAMAQFRAPHARHAEPFATHVHDLAAERLAELVAQVRRPGVGLVGVLECGDPIAVLPKMAERFDLVVVGAHGDLGAERLLFGTVGDRIAGEVRCPVIAIRRAEDALDAAPTR